MSDVVNFLRRSVPVYLWAILTAAWIYYAVGYAVLRLVEIGGVPFVDVPEVLLSTLLDIVKAPMVGIALIAPFVLLEWFFVRSGSAWKSMPSDRCR